ncbi:MAG: amidohydrolase family protein [Phycisphaerales bacterium]|nr:amidohydrolase family protein [Phycisphaerales bacterium]
MNPRESYQSEPSDRGSKLVFVRAAAVIDGAGYYAAPGALLLRFAPPPAIAHAPILLASGSPTEVASHPLAAGAEPVDLSRHVLFPGLVNAHTHLDLTHVGPRSFEATGGGGGFMGWIDMVRAERAVEPDRVVESIRQGIDRSLAAGVVAVGDIAGAPKGRASLIPWQTLSDSPLIGVSYLEFFAMGKTVSPVLERVAELLHEVECMCRVKGDGGAILPSRVAIGLQPHAPNTVSPEGYRRALRLAAQFGVRLSTHLSESEAEREFVADGTGPQRDLLQRLGQWSDEVRLDFGAGRTPVQHFAREHGEHGEPRQAAAYIVAHVNYAGDGDLCLLRHCGVNVAYCPRASEYFGAQKRFGPHRYRDMLARGINVALGTDSVINLPCADRISVLDEMRLLYQRDGTDPQLLLAMATLNGARALGLDDHLFRFAPIESDHPLAGVAALELPQLAADAALVKTLNPWVEIVRSTSHPILLSRRNISRLTASNAGPLGVPFAGAKPTEAPR